MFTVSITLRDRQSVKNLLLPTAFIAVVAESLVAPFYPQFFQQVFGVTAPGYAAWYIAACRLCMMLTFPAWAWVSKKIHTLQLLVLTQAIAGFVSLACAWAPTVSLFFGTSIVMVAFKSSYLLIYPLLVQHTNRKQEAGAIGSMGFIMHVGLICAALLSSFLFDVVNPRYLFVITAGLDFLQMAITLLLLKHTNLAFVAAQEESSQKETKSNRSGWVMVTFGSIIFLTYLLNSSLRPFFTVYAENFVLHKADLATAGILFIIPSFMALLIAPGWQRINGRFSLQQVFILTLVFLTTGLYLQTCTTSLALFIAGRILFGLAIFSLFISLDQLLFKQSKKEDFATNYSIVHAIQNLAMLAAPLLAGQLVDVYSLQAPFIAAMLLIPLIFLLSSIYFSKFKSN